METVSNIENKNVSQPQERNDSDTVKPKIENKCVLPTKPANAFMMFASQRRQKLTEDQVKIGEQQKILRTEWLAMSEKEKEVYHDQVHLEVLMIDFYKMCFCFRSFFFFVLCNKFCLFFFEFLP